MSYHPHSPSIDSNHINKKRKRISHDTEELAWTAARCSRLLRSITSRIAAIRKLANGTMSGETVRPKQTAANRVASHWSTRDPIWMGDAKRKTGTKTFGGRKKVKKQDNPRNISKTSAIIFPSPFVRRMEGGEVSSSPVPFVRPAPSQVRPTRQLPIKPGSPLEEAESGLALAFNSILSCTNSQRPPQPRGTRSLMSTCLRNVPQYIALAEEDEADDDIDSASQIISYLEELGTKDDGGWKGLRQVVRSQAIYAVCEAIEDCVLSGNIVRQLIEHCGCQNSIPEGLEILAAWLDSGECITAKQFATLTAFGREQNCEASIFRLIRNVVGRDCSRMAVLYKVSGFWDNLLRSLTRASSCEAEKLLWTCISHGIDQGDSCLSGIRLGVKETVIRLATMAGSAMLLDNSQTDHGSLSHTVHRLAANAIFSKIGPPSSELQSLLANCSLLLLGMSQGVHGSLSISGISDMLTPTKTSRSNRADFATEIVSSMATLEHHLHSDLTSLLIERMVEQASAAALYKHVALAAITAKRQLSGNSENEALYADYIERISTKSPRRNNTTPRTPFSKTAKARFRWEEGICEWVAKTPFTTTTMAPPTPASIVLKSPKFDDKENRNPSMKQACASIKKEACLLQNSPDILAFSPRKRTVEESPLRPLQAKRKRTSNFKILPQKNGRRRMSRASRRSWEAVDSADELGI